MDRSKWEYKKLEVDNLPIGDVFDIFMGRTPSRDDLSFWEDGNHEWVSIGDMGTTKYISDTKEKVSDKACSNMRLVPKDTVIMSFKLSIGKVAITEIPLYTNEAIMAFPPKSGYNISPNYLYYHLQAYKWQSANRAVMGKTLNKAVISSSRITIPDVETQQRIVAELDCLNGMIALKQEQLKELDKLAQSIFYDMFGDPVENERGWKMCFLKDATTNITDGDHMPPPKSETGVPFVTISNVDKETHQIDFSDTFFVPKEYYDAIPDSKKPQVGDVLYTVTGSYGIPVLLKEKKEFCFQRHIGLIRPGCEIEPVFLCLWAECKPVKEYADRVATGVAQKTVSLKALRNFPIILPPLALQQQFAEKIQAIEAQKELVKKSIAETQHLLDSRMDLYFD